MQSSRCKIFSFVNSKRHFFAICFDNKDSFTCILLPRIYYYIYFSVEHIKPQWKQINFFATVYLIHIFISFSFVHKHFCRCVLFRDLIFSWLQLFSGLSSAFFNHRLIMDFFRANNFYPSCAFFSIKTFLSSLVLRAKLFFVSERFKVSYKTETD